MIVVTVELRSAISGKTKLLGKMFISNDGSSNDASIGNYDVKLANKRDVENEMKIRKSPQRIAKVLNWKRKSNSIWKLVRKSLEELDI